MVPAFLFAVFVFCAHASPFETQIGVPTTKLTNSLAYEIDFSFTNTDTQPLTLCVWNTPFDKSSDVLRADMFNVVTKLGVSAVYTGILMKRIPTASDFVTLQPNETLSAKVDLLKGYWFPQVDQYMISLQTSINIFLGENHNYNLGDFTPFQLSSEVLTVDVVDVAPIPALLQPASLFDENRVGSIVATNSCANNVSMLNTADTNAGTLTSRVRTYLNNNCNGGAYVTWMGACDSTRYSNVRTNFNNIASRISSGYRVNCAGPSCSANTFAYVYPTDTSFWVYVCGAFWRASANTCQFDSRPGTIVHELSHFNSVAATRDTAYGTTACQNLAKSDPSAATKNADSHEYLAEGCP
jgi:peptidyl-Lys metalloendopeptidase